MCRTYTTNGKQLNGMYKQVTVNIPSATQIKDLYARMLLTRIVDDYAWRMHAQGYIDFVASGRGHEAAQVGSAICIEVGKDFTLPYYRDLGVMLAIGMTPYEVFRNYLQIHCPKLTPEDEQKLQAIPHWGYHKHNTVTVPAPTATQILHAAGIAFACKLRKAPIVTVAYCSDDTTSEADFLEGIHFAAQHQLPVIFICEQDCTSNGTYPSHMQGITLPAGLTHHLIDGSDIITVYTAMQQATHHARSGHGPVLLEMTVTRLASPLQMPQNDEESNDPLTRCQHYLLTQGLWDEAWATELHRLFSMEVERAMQDALRDELL
jgi:2-oxoisovalerate dehydrogenase E1 component alpha subunit